MKTKKSVIVVLCGVAVLTLLTSRPYAQSSPNIALQTTFNCPDWNQSMGLGENQVCLVGDGVSGWGGWTTANGNSDRITAAANFPGGAGGKGYRGMVGPGVNNQGGGLRIQFPYEMREVWVRWYMRHQAGFQWELDRPYYEKDLYFNDTLANSAIVIAGYYNSGHFGIGKVNPSGNSVTGSTMQGHWQGINGGLVGDGQWHSFEVHLKMDTNGSNGIAEAWVDGSKVASASDVNYGGSQGLIAFRYFSVSINQSKTLHTTDMYRDYDDFAISNTGYIGPIGGGGQSSQLPSAPVNLRIAP